MNKAEIIARYGEAEYARRMAENAAKRRTPEGRAKRAAYMNGWYHRNAPKVIAAQAKALKAKIEAMPPEEQRAFRATCVSRSKASRLKKLDYYRVQELEYSKARRAAMSPEERKAESHRHWLAKKARLEADAEAKAKYQAERRAYHEAWRERNRDHVNAATREWARKHPEYRKAIAIVQEHRRRAGGNMDVAFVKWIKEQPCVDCGSTERIEVGHIIPVKLGGTNAPANLIPQCRSCNRRLSARPHRLARRTDSG